MSLNHKTPRPRGARPTPRHVLAAARPHVHGGTTPPNCFWIPSKLSYWLNDVDGDCVSAEEYFAKAATTNPEAIGSAAEVTNFITTYGLANGAGLTQVMDLVIANGLTVAGQV